MTALSRWQREDGFPSDEYFIAVTAAIKARGIPLIDPEREEPWDWAAEVDEAIVATGPMARAKHGLFLKWRCDQEDEPTHAEDFTPIHQLYTGWHWVSCSKPGALGDRAENFDLAWLAEPDEVADAVVDLVRGTR